VTTGVAGTPEGLHLETEVPHPFADQSIALRRLTKHAAAPEHRAEYLTGAFAVDGNVARYGHAPPAFVGILVS
jgi:hypothetical protein